jgi:hypothetical protein
MPAFTFEKISPPERRGQIPIAEKQKQQVARKQLGVIVQILGRWVEARVKRSPRQEQGVVAGQQRKPAD